MNSLNFMLTFSHVSFSGCFSKPMHGWNRRTIGDKRKKGIFKRECTNREASGAQNPFGNNDYYRKAIYHQVSQQPYQQQSPQTLHARMEIEESKKAYLVNQDDERSSKGFSWDKYISTDTKACLINQDDERLPKGFSFDDFDSNRISDHKAFVAQIVKDSDDDYYERKMKEHLRFLAERDDYDDANVRVTQKKVTKQDDSDDDTLYYARRMKEYEKLRAEKDDSDMENARVMKKQVKKQDDSDEETVRVIKKQVKEIPAFKIEMEADAEKMSENCENCETMKKQNNILIHNMNRLKESYDVLNNAMNQYNESSSEQATAMKTLNGAYMTKQKVVNNYIEICAELE
ncbi:uncharacterized protein LOC118492326 [Helianthus annuus]|nr:uncharacterized protein LOC118492326 [Helianthus annuus]